MPIPGHETYQVSDLGRVRNRKGRLIGSPPNRRHRYPRVNLDGKAYNLHSVVTRAFLGPCPEGLEVRHSDDDPLNNRLGNLSYGTHRENMRDRTRNGYVVTPEHAAKLSASIRESDRQGRGAGRLAQRVSAAERRAKVVALRAEGRKWVQIADEIGYTHTSHAIRAFNQARREREVVV